MHKYLTSDYDKNYAFSTLGVMSANRNFSLQIRPKNYIRTIFT